jgi:hypothetical protein
MDIPLSELDEETQRILDERQTDWDTDTPVACVHIITWLGWQHRDDLGQGRDEPTQARGPFRPPIAPPDPEDL